MQFFYKIASHLFAWLGYRGNRYVAMFCAFLCFYVIRYRRQVILQNIQIAFPELPPKQRSHIAFQSLVSLFQIICELIAGYKLMDQAVVEFEGFAGEKTFEKLSSNGAYLAFWHMGSWEFLGYYLIKNLRPSKLVVIAKKTAKGPFAEVLKQIRVDHGADVIVPKAGGVIGDRSVFSSIFKRLKDKDKIYFAVDQRRSRGEELPLFGKMMKSNNSLARLYFSRSAPIHPVRIKRLGDGHYRITIEDEVKYQYDASRTRVENVTEFTKMLNKYTENVIRSQPEEYHWWHDRYRLAK